MKVDARKMSTEAQAALRVRAVRSVLSGQTQLAVADVLGISRQVVGRWMLDYRKRGEAAFKSRRRGRKGGHGKLKGWQAATICRMIMDKTPTSSSLNLRFGHPKRSVILSTASLRSS